MSPGRLAGRVLRLAGVLLILLGVVHLIATPHIAALLDDMPPAARAFALGPTLLNHVLVGVLLLPLGVSTWLAADPAHIRETWAKGLLAVNGATLLTLPVLLVALMRAPAYYRAPLFLTGVVLVAAIAVIFALAVWLAIRSKA